MHATISINGQQVPAASGEVIEVHNPAAPSTVVGTIPRCDAADVDRAVAAVYAAFSGWSALSVDERATQLAKGADRLAPKIPELARLQTLEMGKVLAESLADVGTADFMLRMQPPNAVGVLTPVRISNDFGTVTVQNRPLGVVGVIVPWNWPVSLLSVRLASALATGNTVVCLPSPYASLSVLGSIEALVGELPPGVLNVVSGWGPEVGAALTAHPGVRKVSFTGGSRTGHEVMRSAATNFKGVTLELGGNDAALLLDDVVVDESLASGLAEATLTTAGQVCFAVKRVYVARRRFDEVVDAFTARVEKTVLGDGLDPETTMGPLVNRQQAERFDGYLDEARASGASVTELGTVADGLDPEGYFRRPSVVIGADPACGIVREEQFGPAVPFLPFDDVGEAVAQANDTEFGLGASVWSADVERARDIGRRLEAGMVFLNRHSIPAVHPSGIFGGVKQSGIGRELGRWGLESYVEPCEIVDPA